MTGIAPHEFHGSYTGMVCDVMVVRDGFGDACGLPADNPVHVRPIELPLPKGARHV